MLHGGILILGGYARSQTPPPPTPPTIDLSLAGTESEPLGDPIQNNIAESTEELNYLENTSSALPDSFLNTENNIEEASEILTQENIFASLEEDFPLPHTTSWEEPVLGSPQNFSLPVTPSAQKQNKAHNKQGRQGQANNASGKTGQQGIASGTGTKKPRYKHKPLPPYPQDARKNSIEGTVYLHVVVDSEGRPEQVTLAKSSGYHNLDNSAIEHVKSTWTFYPGEKDNTPTKTTVTVPIIFKLN